MKEIYYLTIHASATFPSMDIDIEWIRDIHVNQNGWRDVGYAYFIKRDGTIQKGRPDNVQGAHVGGHNQNNLGICMAGGLKEGTREPEDNYTPAQWIALTQLLDRLTKEHPKAKIMGHNGFAGHESRGCPCFDWRAYRDYFNTAQRCKYKPHDWSTNIWKQGIPQVWMLPPSWYHATLKEQQD